MGTNRLQDRQDDQSAGTGPIVPGTGRLKAPGGRKATAPLHPDEPPKPKYTTAQLRLPPSKRRRRNHPVLKAVVLGAVIFVLGGGGALAGAQSFLGSLGPNGKKLSFGDMANGLVPLSEQQNVLLMGVDYSYTAGSGKRMADGPVRSDTLVVMGADPKGNRLSLISIPRDTRVYVRGHYDKINSALALGGPKLATKVVSELLGVPVTHWAQVNTRGLERIVDEIGGVKLHVEKPMHYTDRTAGLTIALEKGWHRLSGKQAHQFVRFRHDELGDIGRVQRQQQFLRAAAEQMLTPEALLKVPKLMAVVQENVSTNLDGTQLMRLTTWASRLSRDHVKMVMLPGEFSNGRYPVSYWLADGQKTQALGQHLLSPASSPADPKADRSVFKLTVLNGTNSPGLAKEAAAALEAEGWSVWSVGDAPRRDHDKTRVIAQTGQDQWSGEIGKNLGVSAESVSASIGDLTTDFTIIVGKDFDARR